MLTNFLKMAVRVLGRRKFFTTISLVGTSLTLMVLVVVAALFDYAVSPNQLEPHRNRTLYVSYMEMRGDDFHWSGSVGYRFLDRHARDLDGVQRMTIYSGGNGVTTFLDGERVDLTVMRTDGAFWDVFNLTFLEGSPLTDEDDAEARLVAVINESTKRTFFGEGSALGETIEIDEKPLRVVGVVRDVDPGRSSQHADVWVPVHTLSSPEELDELMGGFRAALLVGSKADEARARDAFRAELGAVEFTDDRYTEMLGSPRTPLEELAGELASSEGDPQVGRFLAIAAALMLAFMLLPAVNLMNVTVSRAVERASEIGVRKACGAANHLLIGQFVVENIVLTVLGGLIGFVLAGVTLAVLETGGLLPMTGLTLNVRVFLAGFALSVFFGVLSGTYPAWRMSRVHPVTALKGEM